MKKARHWILLVTLILMTTLVLVGCSTNVFQVNNQTPPPAGQQTPTSPTATTTPIEPTKPAAPNTPAVVAEATYIGSKTCKGCHSKAYDSAIHSGHFQAFRPLTTYTFADSLGEITVFDQANTEKPTSTTINLAKDKIYGVMMDDYIVAEIPESAGFKEKLYRVAAIHKDGDKYTVQAAKIADMDKDGKDDWAAAAYSCGDCHSPGIGVGSKDYGISCESCHGPGSNHLTAQDKKGNLEVSQDSCMACHPSEPTKNKDGVTLAQNHYGTRNYFVSTHASSKQLNNCLTCHSPHKPNADGKLLLADKPADVCMSCHADKNYDPNIIMWANPDDPHHHISKDHSFGALSIETIGDDPATKETEITNPKALELINSKL